LPHINALILLEGIIKPARFSLDESLVPHRETLHNFYIPISSILRNSVPHHGKCKLTR
jgi:hypothetical protein